MRGVSVGGGGGVDDRVMCFSINWSINAWKDMPSGRGKPNDDARRWARE